MNKKNGLIALYIIVILVILGVKVPHLFEKKTPFGDSPQEVVSADTLSYRFDTLTLGSKNDTTPYLWVQVAGISLTDSSSGSKKMARSVSKVSYAILFGDTLETNETFTEGFEKGYAQYSAEKPEHQSWEMTLGLTPLSSTSKLFSLGVSFYSFTGGAHGNYGTLNLIFDIHTGDQITFGDIVSRENLSALTKLGEEQFRMDKEIAPDSSLHDAGYWFDKDEFVLCSNVGLTDSSLVFYYSPYEIAPYALGATTLEIPLTKCQSLLSIEL